MPFLKLSSRTKSYSSEGPEFYYSNPRLTAPVNLTFHQLLTYGPTRGHFEKVPHRVPRDTLTVNVVVLPLQERVSMSAQSPWTVVVLVHVSTLRLVLDCPIYRHRKYPKVKKNLRSNSSVENKI